ncbi:MAG TPA: flagellar assembly protein FliW [Bryobacteraceae bacterium]|nr:flagellar assembly protein FliW [Bryobacteraceae bacterium]
MPQFATAQFGPIDYKEDAVLEFPHGLPAFEDQTQFIAIERPGYSPLVFLQSLLQPELCFLTLPVTVVEPRYELSVGNEDLTALDLDTMSRPRIGSEVLCFAILSVAENRPTTANLLAPVVVNLKNRRAVQAVRMDAIYSHQHTLGTLMPASEGEPCS